MVEGYDEQGSSEKTSDNVTDLAAIWLVQQGKLGSHRGALVLNGAPRKYSISCWVASSVTPARYHGRLGTWAQRVTPLLGVAAPRLRAAPTVP